MPLDSVSITLTSSSVYHSADQINHLPTLALLPILPFLHILFRSMYLWINLYSCPYKDRNLVACLIAQNKERKQNLHQLLKRRTGSEIAFWYRTKYILQEAACKCFHHMLHLLFCPYLCRAMKYFSTSLDHMLSMLIRSRDLPFPSYGKHMQAETANTDKYRQKPAQTFSTADRSYQVLTGTLEMLGVGPC